MMAKLKKLLPPVISFILGAVAGILGKGALPLPKPEVPEAAKVGEIAGEKAKDVVEEKLAPEAPKPEEKPAAPAAK